MSQDLYLSASDLLCRLDAKEASFRKLIFDSAHHNKKLLYKVCFETLKRREGFSKILQQLETLANDSAFLSCPEFLPQVLLYEHLFGHGLSKCNAKWRRAIENHNADLARLKNEVFGLAGEESTDGFSMKKDVCRIPRYARVNTLKITTDEAINQLCNNEWNYLEAINSSRSKYIEFIEQMPQYSFCKDLDLEDLLVFPAGTDLHQEQLVIDRCLVLQDKSSCIPTLCLDVKPGSSVMDLCAAPGMKTAHLAGFMKNEGTIFAYDSAFDRFKLMEDMLSQSGAICIKPFCQDMLRLKLHDKMFKKVEYALLDPPCSGSGMVKRLDHLTDDSKKDLRRLQKLANLQSMMLKHALTLPNLKRLAYSTCSIHEEENEAVVKEVLDYYEGKFKLVSALPAWKHRGLKEYEFGKQCLRASPEIDRTNGFFVAIFEPV